MEIITDILILMCTIVSAAAYCPLGGVMSNDPDLYPCLIVSEDQKSWLDALAVCQYHGGTLPKIESTKQQDYIRANQRVYDYTWFGMNDLLVENEFIWVDRTPVTWYNWRSRQPNGDTGQNCTAVNRNNEWEDKECENLYYYLCEIRSTVRDPVENVFDVTSSKISDQKAVLKRPDSFQDLELLSLTLTGDESFCILTCLYNPSCDSVAYGAGKTPHDCLLYRNQVGGYVPLWTDWRLYTVTG